MKHGFCFKHAEKLMDSIKNEQGCTAGSLKSEPVDVRHYKHDGECENEIDR